VHQSLIYGTTNCVKQSYDYGTTIFLPLNSLSILAPQSSFHLPLRQLLCHNLHSTYQSFNYDATIFISTITSSVMVPQSSLHLLVFQLRYHNLHSTFHSVSYGAIIFCPCNSLHFLCKERCVVGITVAIRKREDGNLNSTMTRESFSL
jgi:hypothetical protein